MFLRASNTGAGWLGVCDARVRSWHAAAQGMTMRSASASGSSHPVTLCGSPAAWPGWTAAHVYSSEHGRFLADDGKTVASVDSDNTPSSDSEAGLSKFCRDVCTWTFAQRGVRDPVTLYTLQVNTCAYWLVVGGSLLHDWGHSCDQTIPIPSGRPLLQPHMHKNAVAMQSIKQQLKERVRVHVDTNICLPPLVLREDAPSRTCANEIGPKSR